MLPSTAAYVGDGMVATKHLRRCRTLSTLKDQTLRAKALALIQENIKTVNVQALRYAICRGVKGKGQHLTRSVSGMSPRLPGSVGQPRRGRLLEAPLGPACYKPSAWPAFGMQFDCCRRFRLQPLVVGFRGGARPVHSLTFRRGRSSLIVMSCSPGLANTSRVREAVAQPGLRRTSIYGVDVSRRCSSQLHVFILFISYRFIYIAVFPIESRYCLFPSL